MPNTPYFNRYGQVEYSKIAQKIYESGDQRLLKKWSGTEKPYE